MKEKITAWRGLGLFGAKLIALGFFSCSARWVRVVDGRLQIVASVGKKKNTELDFSIINRDSSIFLWFMTSTLIFINWKEAFIIYYVNDWVCRSALPCISSISNLIYFTIKRNWIKPVMISCAAYWSSHYILISVYVCKVFFISKAPHLHIFQWHVLSSNWTMVSCQLRI